MINESRLRYLCKVLDLNGWLRFDNIDCPIVKPNHLLHWFPIRLSVSVQFLKHLFKLPLN